MATFLQPCDSEGTHSSTSQKYSPLFSVTNVRLNCSGEGRLNLSSLPFQNGRVEFQPTLNMGSCSNFVSFWKNHVSWNSEPALDCRVIWQGTVNFWDALTFNTTSSCKTDKFLPAKETTKDTLLALAATFALQIGGSCLLPTQQHICHKVAVISLQFGVQTARRQSSDTYHTLPSQMCWKTNKVDVLYDLA